MAEVQEVLSILGGTMNKCLNCSKETPKGHNYCSFDCQIDEAKKNGGVEIRPNGLPIGCIRWDGAMLECEGGDHPTYQFPVEAEFIGKKEADAPDWDYWPETHALIYSDGHMALTFYECCYMMWSIKDGRSIGSSLLHHGKGWRLTDGSRKKIGERWPV